MIITIDGPAGSGKSTVAEILANRLNFIHFNSGSLYRGVTAFLYKKGINIEAISENDTFEEFNLTVEIKDDVQHVLVNNIDFTSMLRDNIISTLVPFVAANPNLRKRVDNCQKEFCFQNNVVMDGRDLGSFVFPNAEFKFYLDCSIEERARRRFNEEKVKNSRITIKEIEEQIKQRDMLDKTRKFAPLVVPENAIIIDSTNLTIEEVVTEMKKLIDLTNMSI